VPKSQVNAMLMGMVGEIAKHLKKGRRIIGVLAGTVEYALFVGLETGRQGRERVGLGGERGSKEAHGELPKARPTQASNAGPAKRGPRPTTAQ
jgi:hypothetical protein